MPSIESKIREAAGKRGKGGDEGKDGDNCFTMGLVLCFETVETGTRAR